MDCPLMLITGSRFEPLFHPEFRQIDSLIDDCRGGFALQSLGFCALMDYNMGNDG
jgi:hypothetical protein